MTEKGRRIFLLIAAVLTAALTARLGVWQLDRARQKLAIQAALEQRLAMPALPAGELAHDAATAVSQHHRRVVLQGIWLPAYTIYLENRQMDARNGFFALTPLRLDDGSAVLVQRGWFPRDQADRTRIVAPPPPAGRVQVQGRIAPGPGRIYEFSGAASGAIRQNLDVGAYARETALPLLPLSLVQEDSPNFASDTPPDGLLRHWPQPAADVHKHYGYAFQWFALAALALFLYAWFQIVRPRRQAQQP